MAPPHSHARQSRPRVIARTGSRRTAQVRARAGQRTVRLASQAHDVLVRVTDAFFALDQAWRFTYVNPEAERILRRSATDLLGHDIRDLDPNITGTALGDAYERAMRDGVTVALEYFYPPLDGWFAVHAYPAVDGLTVYFRDITAERDATQRLTSSEARHRHLVEQVPAVIYSIVLDQGSSVTFLSPFVEELLGDPPEAFVADLSLWTRRVHPDDLPRVRLLTDQADMTAERYTAEYRMVARDGHVVWVHNSATPVLDADGRLTGWHGIVRDMTARKAVEDEWRRMAHRDTLTGLSNRAFLDERLTQLVATEAAGTVAVLFIDLDRFKLVNDAYGHTAGDLLLSSLAQGLSAELGVLGTVSRFGGDEFVAVIPGTTSAGATAIAGRLLDVLRRPVPIAGCDIVIGGSIGVAFNYDRYDRHGSPSDLIREASLALRSAKGTGRDRIVHFDPELDRAGAEITLGAELRLALGREEFFLVYQPVVDAVTGSVTTVEALLRWRHPRRGVLGPARFLRLAEETGLILPIGDWVVEEACRQLRRWDDDPNVIAPPRLTVNLASRQLRDPDLPARIAGSLTRHGLAPSRLRLEISERTTADDLEASVPVVGALHASGIELALDDFGAGSSSLAHLSILPAVELKLDQVFSRRLPAEETVRTIVTGIAALAHALGMAVTAEGIETPEQLRAARNAGCDRIQGHYVAPAMVPDDLAHWLVARYPSPGVDAPIPAAVLPSRVASPPVGSVPTYLLTDPNHGSASRPR